ncbi:MAG: HU family DNA-binding protein [Jatrophihabitans sp.]
MNKTQFIDAVAARLNADHKSTAAILDAVLDEVYANVVKGEKVILTGFGAFERRDRAARIGRNPATGAKVRVKKNSVPAFRPGTEFKEIIAGRRKIAKVAPVKKAAAAKAPAAKAAPVKKAVAKAAAPVRKAVATKAPATKAPAAKAPAAKAAPAKKAAAPVKKAVAKVVAKAAPVKKAAPAKKAAATTPARKTTARKAPAKRA